MASGILASLNSTLAVGSSVTLYTAPAGISYQVVHIFYTCGAPPNTKLTMLLNSIPYEFFFTTSSGSNGVPSSFVMFLSPGDVLSLSCVATGAFPNPGSYKILITGYSVT